MVNNLIYRCYYLHKILLFKAPEFVINWIGCLSQQPPYHFYGNDVKHQTNYDLHLLPFKSK